MKNPFSKLSHSYSCLKKGIILSAGTIFLGQMALAQNTSYTSNSAPISGSVNCAFGVGALNNTTSGNGANTACGYYSLNVNSTGSNNCAYGASSLISNTTGKDNTALGRGALFYNVTGNYNTACGSGALQNNSATENTATGVQASYYNSMGFANTANGSYSLWYNTNGNENTAIGSRALSNNITGSSNTALGASSGTSTGALNNTTALGYGAVVNASNKIRLGNVGVTVVEGPVAYTVSDGRFKSNISESDVKGLAFINKLRPVVYNFETKKLEEFLTKNLPEELRKNQLSLDFSASTAIRQSGFIAQEVETAAKEVGYNFNGVHIPENENDNYSLAYGQFVVPLVKAVQELSQQNQFQQKVNDDLKKELEELKNLIKNVTGINPIENIEESKLFQNIPNSFNQSTTISYSIPTSAQNAMLTIVSLDGKTVKQFDLKNRDHNSVEINSGDLAPGVYLYSLIVNDKMVDSKKMTLTH